MRFRRKLKLIETLTADNPEQHDLGKSLAKITNRRLDLLNRSVELKRSGSTDEQEQGRLRQEIIDVSVAADSLLQKNAGPGTRTLDERREHSERLFRRHGVHLCALLLSSPWLCCSCTTGCSMPS